MLKVKVVCKKEDQKEVEDKLKKAGFTLMFKKAPSSSRILSVG